jgi:hypothetical protein
MENQPQATPLPDLHEPFPVLHEHDFQSKVPFIGPLIQAIRRGLYNLTAKWGIVTLIQQQNQINQTQNQTNQTIAQELARIEELLREQNRDIAQRLQEIEELLIEQDRDMAHTARQVAETGIRQRYLLKHLSSVEHPTSTE